MPAPAPVSTSTWWPWPTSSRTDAGISPTRYSWIFTSFGTPMSTPAPSRGCPGDVGCAGWSIDGQEDEHHGSDQAAHGGEVGPAQRLPQDEHAESGEDRQGDHLLHHLQLLPGIGAGLVADAVG